MMCGSGKTLVTFVFARVSMATNVLFITPVPDDVRKQYIKLCTPSQTCRMHIISSNDASKLLAHNEQYRSTHFNLLVVDESHLMCQNTKFVAALRRVKRDWTLMLSGTAGIKIDIQQQFNAFSLSPDKIGVVDLFSESGKYLPRSQFCVLRLPLTTTSQKTYNEFKTNFEAPGANQSKIFQIIRAWLAEVKMTHVIHKINQLLTTNSTNRIVIFSSFATVLFSIFMGCDSDKVCRYYRGMSGVKKNALAGQLSMYTNNIHTKRVLLVDTCIGAHGINLPHTNHLFILDPPLTKYEFTQMRARIQRLNSRASPTVHVFICENTLESRLFDEYTTVATDTALATTLENLEI